MSDYKFKESASIPFERVKEWSAELYEKLGMSKEDALIMADIQATADVRGVYSHGIQRASTYTRRIQDKSIDAKAKPEIIRDAGALVLVDGKNAMGQISAYRAMKIAIEKAREFNVSAVAVKGGSHLGAMAYYAMMASQEDMVGICYAQGAANTLAPFGGKEKFLGNNPIGYAIPAFSKPDVVLDMALSTVAGGKLHMHLITGDPIPDTWALDKDGNPVTNPADYYSLQPIAGYKGYGLSFVTTLLTAVLCSCPWGRNQVDLIDANDKRPLNISYIMQAINIGAIVDVEEFKKRVDEAIDQVKISPRRDGVEEILVPGEPEARMHELQLKNGIAYPVELIRLVEELSGQLGISALA